MRLGLDGRILFTRHHGPGRVTRARSGLLVVALSLLTGCVNQQNEIDKYRSVLDECAPATQPAFCPDDTLTLEQAMVLANRDYEQLAIRGEDYVQALIDKDRAFSAFLPTISLQPRYFQQEKYKPGGIAGLLAPSTPYHTFDLPLSGQWNVFNGFRDVAAVRRAAATIDQQRALLLDLQQCVLLEVAQTYYAIIRAEQSVEVLKNSAKVQEDRVRDIRARQQVGLARVLDVSQTEAQASGTRVQLIEAQRNVRNGRATLAFLIGQPCVAGPLTDRFEPPAKLPNCSELLAVAEANRQDIQATIAAVRAAQENLQSAIRQYFPSASLNVNYFITRQSLPKEVDWNGFININVPLFTGGLIESNIRTAWSVLRQAKLTESLTRRRVREQVETALNNLQASGHRRDETTIELKAAQEAYTQAVESYKVGLATNLDTLIAQDRLLLSQLQLTSELYNYKIFYLDLERAIGKLTFLPDSAAPRPSSQSAGIPAQRPATRASAESRPSPRRQNTGRR